jgi:uncharacterized protein (UPF0147 family)
MSNENRRRFEEQVRASVSKYRVRAEEEGLESVPAVTAAAPLAVAGNRQTPAVERVAALHALAPDYRNDEAFVALLLRLAGDTTEPAELRAGVLRVLRQLRFSSVVLNENRARYVETLRPIVDDPDPTLREDALSMLAQVKDEYAQTRLVDSLTTEAPTPAPLEKTIQFLGYDAHAAPFPELRKVARNGPTPEARREAVRVLASDPDSIDVLREVFRDKREDQQVRRAAANAYISLDPAGFEKDAKAIVADEGEDTDVRAACLSALAHFAHPSARDEQLNGYVASLEKRDIPKPLAEAVRSYRRKGGSD